jgi:hypothetical protein
MSDTTNTNTNDAKFAAAEAKAAKAKAKADMTKAIEDTAKLVANSELTDEQKLAKMAKDTVAKANAAANKATEVAAAKTKKDTEAAEAKTKRDADKAAKAAKSATDDAARNTHRESAHAEVARRGADLRATCLCGCGCGQQVPRSVFLPGHDSKLASAVLAALVNGKTDAEIRVLVCAAVATTKTDTERVEDAVLEADKVG